jgi:hypothetical protein
MTNFSKLEKAARDAATSLGTISRLAGRETYGTPPIPTFMGSFVEVRGYAKSRATAAIEEIKAATGAHKEPAKLSTEMRRWELADGEDAGPHEPTYDMTASLEAGNYRLYVEVKLKALDEKLCAPGMSLGLEINCGLPCIHVYSNAADEVQMSIFAMPDGTLRVRQGDGGAIQISNEIKEYRTGSDEQQAPSESAPAP